MRHVPKTTTSECECLTFEEALAQSLVDNAEYDVEKWLYVPNTYCEYRYVLGTCGNNPLIVIGVNPSTAAPDALDPTLQSAERIAHSNDYDSFLMLNVYPQRATDPNDMEKNRNSFLEKENVEAFKYLLSLSPSKDVWCAWGNVVSMRGYLRDCVNDLVAAGDEAGANWLCAGEPLKSGNPHHPLYLKTSTRLQPFRPN